MRTRSPRSRDATLEDFLAIAEGERFHELIDGEIREKAAPSGEHGAAQLRMAQLLGPFDRRAGGPPPGGWWFATEVECLIRELPRRVVRPDVAGWRRDRHPGPPRGTLVTARPDWVCEILSATDRARDLVDKKLVYHQARVEHYFLVDPEEGTLLVYRWHDAGYLEVLAAQRGDTVRAEPFAAIELRVATLLGDDEPEDG